jgi:membrane protein implicated in regulation of membrane protease activity
MIWWLALGLVLLGLVILVLAVLPVLRRLAALERAMRRAQSRQAEVAVVQQAMAEVQQRVAVLGERALAVQAKLPGDRGTGLSRRG